MTIVDAFSLFPFMSGPVLSLIIAARVWRKRINGRLPISFYLFLLILSYQLRSIAYWVDPSYYFAYHKLNVAFFFSTWSVFGPLLYTGYIESMFFFERKTKARWLFIFPAICFLGDVMLLIVPGLFDMVFSENKAAVYRWPFQTSGMYSVIVLLYSLYLIVRANAKYGFRPVKWLTIFFSLFMTIMVLSQIAVVINSQLLTQVALLLGIGFLSSLLIWEERFSEVLAPGRVAGPQSELNSSNPALADSEVARLRQKLELLMNDSQIFTDPDLSLQSLAADMQISASKLSRFLNHEYKEPFYDFVSRHRIEEAKRLLSDVPDANIQRIAFRSGFRSKSTFYSRFIELTGQTPSEFRSKYKS